MTEGVKTIMYSVTDLAGAKTLFGELLGVEPYMDETYYVGLKALLDAGAEAHQGIRDVGGGKLLASVKDADSNVIGLLQSA
jgi:hypothetical protein